MKLRPLALATAMGIMGIVYMLVVTYYPMLSETVLGMTKGEALRAIMEDIYPYYDHNMWHAPLVGASYGFVDAFFFGLIAAWLYNGCLCGCSKCCDAPKKVAKSAPTKTVKKTVAKKAVVKKAAPRKTAKKKTTTRKKK
jgi:hypothetical protein